MEAVVSFAEVSGIYAFMHSQWGWPFIESLHFIGLCLLIGSVGVFDLRMLGVARGIPLQALHKLVPVGVLGFLLNAVTGLMFFVSAPDQYAYNPAFQLKMLFMLCAGINMLIFYQTSLANIRATPANNFPPKSVMLIAAISLGCWTMVILFGRLITYFRPPYHWDFWF